MVDCRSVAELLSGRYVLHNDDLRPIFLRLSRMLLRLPKAGYMPIRNDADYVRWSPREYNGVADYAVNRTLDEAKDWSDIDLNAVRVALSRKQNILVCVDGGLRNGKLGACGFAIYTAHWNDVFEYEFLGWQGTQLNGVASAFLAETLGLEASLNFLVDLF